MRRNYIREKKIICGDSYMAVCLYAITPQERNTRGKKQKNLVKGRKPEQDVFPAEKQKKGCCELHEEWVLPFRDV